MESKKTKLTISGTAKKSIKNIEIAKTQVKNSRVIEKQGSKFTNRAGSFRPGVGKPKSTPSFNRGAPLKPSFEPKSSPITLTIKSDSCTGRNFKCVCVPCPHPFPNSPQDPKAVLL